ncbi:MAG: hypothetical protein ABIO05_05045 [Ferruginibacter sp.]
MTFWDKVWFMAHEYYLKNKEKLLLKAKEYYQKNKIEIRRKQIKRNILNKEKRKQYNIKNKNKLNGQRREYEKLNKLSIKDRIKKYKDKNTDKVKVWRITNRKYRNQYIKSRTRVDPLFKLTITLRNRLYIALKGTQKTESTLKLIGCNLVALTKHLESKFQEGMSWANHSKNGWHIDHIIPCNKFDLTKLEEQQKCFHYTNLQPLWAKDNLIKGTKIIFS